MAHVSVIIPLYNKAATISRAMNSVLAQTVDDLELIVVDDGSTDGGWHVARRCRDVRVRLIAQDNGGVSAARNRGIAEAVASRVAFLDADDEWEPWFLETILHLQERCPNAGVFGTAYGFVSGTCRQRPRFVGCPRDVIGGYMDDYFVAAMGPAPLTASSVMVPKDVLSEVGLFAVGVSRGEDLDLWTRIALRHPVAWSPMTAAIYHLEASNRACRTPVDEPDVACARAIEEHLAACRVRAPLERSAAGYLASRRIMHAISCYLEGRTDRARELLRKAASVPGFRIRSRSLRWLMRLDPQLVRSGMAARDVLVQWRDRAFGRWSVSAV